MDDVAKSYGVKFPPYTPIDSLRDELGIMFGFLAACILTVGIYYVLWQGGKPSPLSSFFPVSMC